LPRPASVSRFGIPSPALALVFLAVQVVVGLAAKWMAVRVHFDGVVFAELVHAVHKTGFRTEHLDRALRGVGMLAEGKEGRDWIRGAVALSGS
jgi:hypothetical protein